MSMAEGKPNLQSCRKNGYPAITDANLVLGRIDPDFFPSIFGETEDKPLDHSAAFAALQVIAEDVNEQTGSVGQPKKSVDEVCFSSFCACFFRCLPLASF